MRDKKLATKSTTEGFIDRSITWENQQQDTDSEET